MKTRGRLRHSTFALIETLNAVETVRTLRALAHGTPNEITPKGTRRMAEMADLIDCGSSREIITQIRGRVADGLLGVFDRLGDDPLPMGHYGQLADLFEKRDPRAGILCQIEGKIEPGIIEALLIIDEVALHPAIASAITSPRMAKNLNSCINRLRATTNATDNDLRESLKAVAKPVRLHDWVDRMLSRHFVKPHFEHPIAADDPLFKPLLSASDMFEAGKSLSNCIGQKIALVASGRNCFFVTREIPTMRPEDRLAFMATRLSTAPHWAITQMFGPRNKALSLSAWEGALAMLATRGLPVVCLPDMEGQAFLNSLDFLDFDMGVDPPSLDDGADAA